MERPEEPQAESTTTNSLKNSLLALTALNQDTILLDYGNIIIRRGYQELKTVRILSGGAAGCDLCHAFLVGRGMLTAAILEEDVTPMSRQILRTIQELHQGEAGGVFVLCRSGSEMFNFNLAVERANADCQARVRLLAVSDSRSPLREGDTCGFILVGKVVGAMAEEGVFFDDIYEFYNENLRSIITVPLNYKQDVRRHTILEDFSTSVACIIDPQSQTCLQLHHSVPTVALINTSRNLEKIAQLDLVRQVLERLKEIGVCVVRIYSGNFMAAPPDTATLTVMKVLDNRTINYLDAPCQVAGWHHVRQSSPEITLRNEFPAILTKKGKQRIPERGPRLSHQQVATLIKSVQFVCEALIACERQLNIVDSDSSKGNVGTRLRVFAECLRKKLTEQKMSVEFPYAFLRKLGVVSEAAMGGTMGTIYGVLFENSARVFEGVPEEAPITAETWREAFVKGVRAVRRCSGEEAMNATLCFPLRQCKRALYVKGDSFVERFGLGVSQAEEAAQKTCVPPKRQPDAGAHAVGIWMRALFEGVKLLCFEQIDSDVIKLCSHEGK